MSQSRTLVGALVSAALVSSACSKGESHQTEGGAAKGPGADGAAGRSAGGPGGPGGGRRGPMSLTLAPTDVKPVERGLIEGGPAISGNLKPIEEINVRSRLEGNLLALYAREGDNVRQGQVIARFESSEQEGNQRSAAADVAAAQADVATAQWNADQSAELFKAGAIPERDFRTAQQAVAAAKARLAAAEARVRSTSIATSDTRVLAPTTGVVSQRLIEKGEHVTRGASMFTIVRNDVLELEAAVPARQANEVRAGQRATFATAGRVLEGRVARVSPTINPANQSITVYVQVPNPGGVIKGNSFATGRVVARRTDGALLVPTSAVRQNQTDGRPFVYRVAGGVVDRAPVDLGIVDEARGVAEIVQGLAVGDRVIVGNVGAVGTGMKVTILGGDRGGATAEPRGPRPEAQKEGGAHTARRGGAPDSTAPANRPNDGD